MSDLKIVKIYTLVKQRGAVKAQNLNFPVYPEAELYLTDKCKHLE